MSPMIPFRADLHCHSTCSDGLLTPQELVQYAKQIGLSGLSITDHDTVAAYKEAIPKALELGLKMISGIEFSTLFADIPIHVLAYSFQLDHPSIQNYCQKHIERRHTRNLAIVAKLQQQGFNITYDEILQNAAQRASQTIGRPHIAMLMMEKGYVDSMQNAFKKYLGEKGLCYVPGTPFSTEETLQTIHATNGFAIIAHPHLIPKSSTVKRLLNLPFDGIEAYYASFSADENNKWVKIAQERNWLMTGGSDFHGSIKPINQLGSCFVNEETFQILAKRFHENENI